MRNRKGWIWIFCIFYLGNQMMTSDSISDSERVNISFHPPILYQYPPRVPFYIHFWHSIDLLGASQRDLSTFLFNKVFFLPRKWI